MNSAFEINVPRRHGKMMWETLAKEIEKHNGTAYGTETMHVLRAEKGYIIVGQDTDGTVTPQDAGMSWAIGKKKLDFVGKRGLERPDLVAENRKAVRRSPDQGPEGQAGGRRADHSRREPGHRHGGRRPCDLVLLQPGA